jgi:hypothetical protein
MMMKKALLTFCFILVLGGFLRNDLFAQYDVAAFIWPSYHPDDRAKIFWPEGIGEWQTVLSNKPKFEGHEQPRYPL